MKNVIVIDQTIREGMQHRGVFFSLKNRERILDFQKALGINVCQAGYPPAHACEIEYIRQLNDKAVSSGYDIRVAGLGRVFKPDAASFIETGVKDIHLHMGISEESDMALPSLEKKFEVLRDFMENVRKNTPDAIFGLSILDIGKYSLDILKQYADYLARHIKLDILTLPDTSGMMAPNLLYEKIKAVSETVSPTTTRISVHCHNDMGMASANTVMGVFSGATVIETSAMGIGERNGIGDLYTTCRILIDQGYELSVDVSLIDIFREYYEYVSGIVQKQTGISLLTYNTPFFGDALKTHVAGTHGRTSFGIETDEAFFINVLCGKSLVKKYLDARKIRYDESRLPEITSKIKDCSVTVERALKHHEIRDIAENI